MQKNVNLGLLTLVVVIVLFMAAVTIYYQSTYQDISTDFRTKLGELEKTKTALVEQQSQLNQTSEELQLKMEREQALSGLYLNVTDENEYLRSRVNELEADLATTKQSLTTITEKWQAAEKEAADAKALAEQYKESYELAKAKAEKYASIVKKLSSSVAELASTITTHQQNQGLGQACLAAIDDIADHFTPVEENTGELENVQ